MSATLFCIHGVDRDTPTRGGMSPDEVLAVIRLRQWRADKTALACAHTVDPKAYQRSGWKQRRQMDFDARLVRVIDFERALSELSEEEQGALMLKYGERQNEADVAQAIRCSPRKVSYLLPQARAHLADALDRLDLL